MSAQDDLTPEEVAAAKRKSRLNALILGVVFLLISFAPRPWNAYAPLLFIIPLIYSLANKFRAASSVPRLPGSSPGQTPKMGSENRDPYSYTPRDPDDPRKYKPIG